jgi:sugar phosphate isomerase/epimerase
MPDGDRPEPRLGIFARTFAGSAPLAVLTQARDAGFDSVQYNMACSGLPSLPGEIAPAVIEAMVTASSDTGIGLVALSATYNMIHPDRAVRADGRQSLEVLAAAAHSAGIPMLTLCTGSRNAEDQWAPHADNGSAEAWRDLLDGMAHAISVAEQHDLSLGVEPEPSNVVGSALLARRLLEDVHCARVGIVLDAANLIESVLSESSAARNTVISEAVDTLADRIVLVHAKDRAASGAFVAPGDGVVDFAAYFSALAAAGVHAPVITHGLTAHDAPRAAVLLRAALVSARR